MRRIFFLLSAVLALHEAKAQNAEQYIKQAQGVTEALAVNQTTHDFGKIPQGKPVFYEFEITNKTSAPLKLDNVQASCGCTTPEWHKEPIAAGATDKIKVGYNAAAEGPFEKFITITYNGNASKQIIIKGTVWKAPTESAPANASVQFLKQQIQ
jgi:hypothetical protein